MSNKKSYGYKRWSYFSLIFIGTGIGCLVGLSISPVISTVISSVTGVVAGIVAAMSGLEKVNHNVNEQQTAPSRWQVNPIPFALLMAGILFGVGLGMAARNTHLLGSDISVEISKWSKTGLSEQEIANRIFETQYPKAGQTVPSETSGTRSDTGTVLFAVGTNDCNQLYRAAARSHNDLVAVLEDIEHLSVLSTIITDESTLKEVVQQVLCQ